MSLEDKKDEVEILERDEEYEYFENYSSCYCSKCGTRMEIREWEEFEDTCEGCIWEDTQGIITDDPYSKL
jgi:hypothetical protein